MGRVYFYVLYLVTTLGQPQVGSFTDFEAIDPTHLHDPLLAKIYVLHNKLFNNEELTRRQVQNLYNFGGWLGVAAHCIEAPLPIWLSRQPWNEFVIISGHLPVPSPLEVTATTKYKLIVSLGPQLVDLIDRQNIGCAKKETHTKDFAFETLKEADIVETHITYYKLARYALYLFHIKLITPAHYHKRLSKDNVDWPFAHESLCSISYASPVNLNNAPLNTVRFVAKTATAE